MVYKHFMNNPCKKNIGDCAVRAISVALDVDWYTAFDLLAKEARKMCDMPSADAVWGAVLRRYGFTRSAISNNCFSCYTAEDFCYNHQRGTYVLAFGGHVATIKDGTLFDSWDSSSEIPLYYYCHY